MLRNILLLLVCVALLLNGCNASDNSTAVKTMDEYRAEAAKDINAANVDAEAAKLIKEVNEDSADE